MRPNQRFSSSAQVSLACPSMALAQSIEDRYKALGGEVEDDYTVGVRLADGSAHHADIVISAADGCSTVFDLLGGRYVNDAIRQHYAALPVADVHRAGVHRRTPRFQRRTANARPADDG